MPPIYGGIFIDICAIIGDKFSLYGVVILSLLYDAKFFSSRLLGQSRFFAEPGAVMDIAWQENNQEIADLYVKSLQDVLALLPIKNYELKTKVFYSGINIALRYPYDLLMVACEILDWVWDDVVDFWDLERPINTKKTVTRFKAMIKENQQLLLRKIHQKALNKKLSFFIHKDILVLGSGVKQFSCPLNKITKLNDIPWSKISNIPTILITGTNGKTTTTRLTEFICRRAKLKSGYCSTDWVMIDGKLVSEGDLSGPMGHQYVLMHPKVEVAVLEVARGGIVKRGLLPNYANVATVTNIAYDHIGQNGIENLTDLAEAKGIVYQGLAEDGVALINLDDEYIVNLDNSNHKCAYLSTKLGEDKISSYLNENNFVVYLDNGYITIKTLTKSHKLNKIDSIPLTVSGLATYNFENTLHAVGLCFAIGVEPEQIKRGLAKFGADDKSNFGRWNYYNSAKYGHLVVDIAHNPAGLENILSLAQQFRKLHNLTGKLGLMYGNTADRRDTIPEISQLICKYNVDYVVIKEFQGSLRGSELGEMPQVFYDELIKAGYPAEQINIIPNEVEAVQHILDSAQPNDMNLLCSHELINDVSRLLRSSI